MLVPHEKGAGGVEQQRGLAFIDREFVQLDLAAVVDGGARVWFLVTEYEMEGISYSTVCDYVSWRRPEIKVEAGGAPPREVPIDQEHKPGVEAEADFGDVVIDLAGELTACYMFVFRQRWFAA
ncbi:hypothetical protein [Nonomuraea sp. NBC_00507]|uniref:hypothetical protein n=1 Tax=Nonomuraea sp. NBC_00507 TaxID=2976002 RepID=UPI003FA526D6